MFFHSDINIKILIAIRSNCGGQWSISINLEFQDNKRIPISYYVQLKDFTIFKSISYQFKHQQLLIIISTVLLKIIIANSNQILNHLQWVLIENQG